MVPVLTQSDLLLINNLSARTYKDNTLLSNATNGEKADFVKIKEKLKLIGEYFQNRYNDSYGPFDLTVATGNPLAIGGTKFKRVWSGIYKGSVNKQYAAQVSFVINQTQPCLDVGFYFGRASSHSFSKDQIKVFKKQLISLRNKLSDRILSNRELHEKYNLLFDYGFNATVAEKRVLGDDWLVGINDNINEAQIIAKLTPNEFGIIELSTIDLYVSMIIAMMTAVDSVNIASTISIKPLTPEQRAKQAERRALIGEKGELFAMEFERSRLKTLALDYLNYPKHVALHSMAYGYDILSLDENGDEILIEVKTTTRMKGDRGANIFFISSNEFQIFSDNKARYKIYRVFDIDVSPHIDFVEVSQLKVIPDGYIAEY